MRLKEDPLVPRYRDLYRCRARDTTACPSFREKSLSLGGRRSVETFRASGRTLPSPRSPCRPSVDVSEGGVWPRWVVDRLLVLDSAPPGTLTKRLVWGVGHDDVDGETEERRNRVTGTSTWVGRSGGGVFGSVTNFSPTPVHGTLVFQERNLDGLSGGTRVLT